LYSIVDRNLISKLHSAAAEHGRSAQEGSGQTARKSNRENRKLGKNHLNFHGEAQ
jgi:hypothetical protein